MTEHIQSTRRVNEATKAVISYTSIYNSLAGSGLRDT